MRGGSLGSRRLQPEQIEHTGVRGGNHSEPQQCVCSCMRVAGCAGSVCLTVRRLSRDGHSGSDQQHGSHSAMEGAHGRRGGEGGLTKDKSAQRAKRSQKSARCLAVTVRRPLFRPPRQTVRGRVLHHHHTQRHGANSDPAASPAGRWHCEKPTATGTRDPLNRSEHNIFAFHTANTVVLK